jgi:hypothetical protein
VCREGHGFAAEIKAEVAAQPMGRLIDFNLYASDDGTWRWEGGVYPDSSPEAC